MIPATVHPTLRRAAAALRRRHQDQRGVALPLALVVLLILAALAMALAELTTAELDTGRWTRWDVQAQYLAQAGMESQIYALKANKDGAALAAVNYPVTVGQEYWYSTTLTCLLQCGTDGESRRWRIVSTGEIRESGGGPILQARALRADVEIAYAWDGTTSTFRLPTGVTILRWEEVYP